MHRQFLVVAFLLLYAGSLLGQTTVEFAPVGSKWWYTTEYCEWKNCGYYTLEVVDDTVLLGKDASVLQAKEYGKGSLQLQDSIEIVASDSGRVYRYYDNKFYLLADFNLQPGDTLTVQDSTKFAGYFDYVHKNGDTVPKFEYVIDTFETIVIDGESLKVMKTIPTPGSYWVLRGFNEKLGSGGIWIFAGLKYHNLGGYYGGLRCYQDSTIFYKDIDSSCTYISTSIKEAEDKREEELATVFPTLPNDVLFIQFNGHDISGSLVFHIYDILGRPVKEQTITSPKMQISLDDLTKTIYFYKITKRNRILKTGKLVVR